MDFRGLTQRSSQGGHSCMLKFLPTFPGGERLQATCAWRPLPVWGFLGPRDARSCPTSQPCLPSSLTASCHPPLQLSRTHSGPLWHVPPVVWGSCFSVVGAMGGAENTVSGTIWRGRGCQVVIVPLCICFPIVRWE